MCSVNHGISITSEEEKNNERKKEEEIKGEENERKKEWAREGVEEGGNDGKREEVKESRICHSKIYLCDIQGLF